MAITLATITGNVADLIGDDFSAHRTKVWIDSNAPEDYIADLDNETLRLGTATYKRTTDGKQGVEDDGSFSFEVIATGSDDTNLDDSANLQYTVYVDYAQASDRSRPYRNGKPFGPYAVTTSANIVTLVAEQAVDVAYTSALLAEMEALRDQQEEIAGLADSDEAQAYNITNGTATPAALSAAYVDRTRVWDARENGIPGDGSTLADTAFDALLALMNPGDTLHVDNAMVVKFATRHNIDQKIVIDADGATFLQASTTGVLRFIAGSDGSKVRNLIGVGPSGSSYADDSRLIYVQGTAGGTWVEGIELENITGKDWGRAPVEMRYTSNILTRNVRT